MFESILFGLLCYLARAKDAQNTNDRSVGWRLEETRQKTKNRTDWIEIVAVVVVVVHPTVSILFRSRCKRSDSCCLFYRVRV